MAIVHAFGIAFDDAKVVKGVDLSDSRVDEYGLELDKETGSTHPVVTGQVDIDEVVQSYKDQCGMVMAMRLIQSGQVDPMAFADDGQHGADCSFPTDLNTSAMLANMSDEEAQALAAKLGIENYKADDINALVDARIKEIFAKADNAGKAAE